MSSSERSHSAVRNLRNIFENKATTDTDTAAADTRGRSPAAGRLSNLDANGRPLSKVRASFVAVEPPQIPIQDAAADMASPPAGRESSIAARRASFSMDPNNKSAIAEMKQDLQDEQIRRSSNPNVETIPEGALNSAATTPAVEPREDQAMGDVSHAASKLSQMTVAPGNENEPPADPSSEPPMNPDKPTTGAEEEEEGSLMPAEPENEAAVSGGEALPPVAEDLRKQEQTDSAQATAGSEVTPQKSVAQPVTTGKDGSQKSISVPSTSSRKESTKPSPVSVDSSSKAAPAGSLKSPEMAKSPTSNKSSLSPKAAPARDVTRKASRSSLAAPTAASAARTSRESFSSKSSAPAAKPKPRETTKPASISSHLMAPTAASRAKHEAEGTSKPAPATQRPATTARAKPQPSSTKPTPRSSLARPESRNSQAAPRKTAPPPDGSFLERMMRPTAASANKVHEKTEVKSPPRKTAAPLKKPSASKTNGVAKQATKTTAAAPKPAASKTAEKALETATADTPAVGNSNGVVHEPSELDVAASAETPAAGNDTPLQDKSASPTTNGALESTPAFGEEGIR